MSRIYGAGNVGCVAAEPRSLASPPHRWLKLARLERAQQLLGPVQRGRLALEGEEQRLLGDTGRYGEVWGGVDRYRRDMKARSSACSAVVGTADRAILSVSGVSSDSST